MSPLVTWSHFGYLVASWGAGACRWLFKTKGKCAVHVWWGSAASRWLGVAQGISVILQNIYLDFLVILLEFQWFHKCGITSAANRKIWPSPVKSRWEVWRKEWNEFQPGSKMDPKERRMKWNHWAAMFNLRKIIVHEGDQFYALVGKELPQYGYLALLKR